MFVYGHDRGCAIIGGFIVRDPTLPTLGGRYIYTDFCEGDVRSFRPDVAAKTARDDKSLGLSVREPSTFGRGVNGEVYLATSDALFRLKP